MTFKEGSTINNSNGIDYKVLEASEHYLLLEELSERFKPYYKQFVVAYETELFKDGYSWSQGHYFTDLEAAQDYYYKKANYYCLLISPKKYDTNGNPRYELYLETKGLDNMAALLPIFQKKKTLKKGTIRVQGYKSNIIKIVNAALETECRVIEDFNFWNDRDKAEFKKFREVE